MLIAFAAPAGAGKTTMAKMLVEHRGFTRISFAEPLYAMLEAGGFGRPTTPEQKLELVPALHRVGLDVTWRHAAQTLGTEWGRRCIGENVWTALALSKCSDPEGNYVIDDCRFENEATAIRQMGGTIVHIVGRRAELGASSGHASESGIAFDPECDYRLDNGGSMADLWPKLLNMLFTVSLW